MLLEGKVNPTEQWISLLEAAVLMKFLLTNTGLVAWNMKAFLITKKIILDKYFKDGIRWVVLSSLSRREQELDSCCLKEYVQPGFPLLPSPPS